MIQSFWQECGAMISVAIEAEHLRRAGGQGAADSRGEDPPPLQGDYPEEALLALALRASCVIRVGDVAWHHLSIE